MHGDEETTTGPPPPRRLSREQRREMLIEATVPLVVEHGCRVTTKQIAEAGGIAEGTIFRAFPDKEALIRAAVTRAFDIAPVLAELGEISLTAPLRDRLVAITATIQRYILMIFNMMIALGSGGPPPGEKKIPRADQRYAGLVDKVCQILEPDRDAFRVPLPEVVRIMRLLTFAGSHPMLSEGRLMTGEEIVDVLLLGVMRPPEPFPTPPTRSAKTKADPDADPTVA